MTAGLMHGLKFAAPPVSLAILVVFGALPWGLPADYRFFFPMLPIVAIYYWSWQRLAPVKAWMVFAAGLIVDVLTNGPLGYWALIYLGVPVAGEIIGSFVPSVSRPIVLTTTLCIAAVAAWLLSSLYFFEVADWRPYALGALLAGLGALLLLPVLRLIDAEQRGRRPIDASGAR